MFETERSKIKGLEEELRERRGDRTTQRTTEGKERLTERKKQEEEEEKEKEEEVRVRVRRGRRH